MSRRQRKRGKGRRRSDPLGEGKILSADLETMEKRVTGLVTGIVPNVPVSVRTSAGEIVSRIKNYRPLPEGRGMRPGKRAFTVSMMGTEKTVVVFRPRKSRAWRLKLWDFKKHSKAPTIGNLTKDDKGYVGNPEGYERKNDARRAAEQILKDDIQTQKVIRKLEGKEEEDPFPFAPFGTAGGQLSIHPGPYLCPGPKQSR